MSNKSQKPASKKELIEKITTLAGVSKSDAVAMYEALVQVFVDELSGPGVVNLPGILRAKVVVKPATKERNSVNPFTKEPMVIAAKPATKAVKVSAAKALKDKLLA